MEKNHSTLEPSPYTMEEWVPLYQDLSSVEREFVQFCSLYFDPMSLGLFFELAKNPSFPKTILRFLTKEQCEEIVASLQEKDVFVISARHYWVVEPLVQDMAVQDSVESGSFETYASFIQTEYPYKPKVLGFSSPTTDPWRDARIEFYRGNGDAFFELFNGVIKGWSYRQTSVKLLFPFNKTLFLGLPDTLKNFFLDSYCAVDDLTIQKHASASPYEVFDDFEGLYTSSGAIDETRVVFWVDVLVSRGQVQKLRALNKELDELFPHIAGCADFLQGADEAAWIAFEEGCEALKKISGAKSVLLPKMAGIFHALLCLKINTPETRKKLDVMWVLSQSAGSNEDSKLYGLIHEMGQVHTGKIQPSEVQVFKEQSGPLLHSWLSGYWSLWLSHRGAESMDLDVFIQGFEQYSHLGFSWFAAEFAAFASQADTKTGKKYEKKSASLHRAQKTVSRSHWIEKEPEWKRKLTSAVEVAKALQSSKGKNQSKEFRLIWEFLTDEKENIFTLKPFLQQRNASGNDWKKGRPVAISRLQNRDLKEGTEAVMDQDRQIAGCFENHVDDRLPTQFQLNGYALNMERAAKVLPGHPLIFHEGDRTSPIEVIDRAPRLSVSQTETGLIKIALDPEPTEEETMLMVEGPYQLAIVSFAKVPESLLRILNQPILVPPDEKDQVMGVIEAMSPFMTVHTEVEGTYDESLASPGDTTPHVHLLPFKEGIRAQFFVRPFGLDEGPYFRPGEGAALVVADIQNQNLYAKRDLDQEISALSSVFSSCPSLEVMEASLGEDRLIPVAADALEVLVELKSAADDNKLVLHWPKKKVFDLVSTIGAGGFSMQIRKKNQWFEASGELQVDDSLVLNMQQLLDLKWVGASRFVQLDDGRFLAISKKLRSRIDALRSYGTVKKDVIRFAPIQAAALNSSEDIHEVDGDKHWQSLVEKISQAQKLSPQVPEGILAELRDYQVEGFCWLSRLAEWGAGACLADDMGLGKTIQALALLLRRASEGPALVVAPTSLIFNWQKEAERFAPSLKVHVLNEKANRKKVITSMKENDVLLSSYGLLDSESETLATQPWHSVILDEAQAIKNHATKRSKAAMKLKADFRMILTGTPLENHLEELWNLFHFINPGLLGSKEHFRNTFVAPMIQEESVETGDHLRGLIQPFLLRRTKSQVLKELPERMDITYPVELTEKETVFYEALRQKAESKLSGGVDGKKQSLQIFAELMKLRRACCHPKLVDERSPIEGSKLKVFSRLLDDLLENGHKVLVFSQFVDHLSIVRETLDAKGIGYQYLDGQTPAKVRQQRVDAFQNGEKSVFLISLKAGGFGLNLTEANYVIHLDPWWNPAVEDQASDRAHRIGQKRAVTVYRLVTKGTIEEKIVALHGDKRDLADKLLEGTDRASKLSTDELLDLIRQH